MKVGNYAVSYDTTNKMFFSMEVLCIKKEKVTNGNIAEGNYNYGDEYSCELGDGEEKNILCIRRKRRYSITNNEHEYRFKR